MPYVLEGRERTYRNDFYVPLKQIVYEVKPSYVLKRVSAINDAKWAAARAHLQQQGIEFRVVTERDFQKITFDVARQDVDVVWKEKTFKYFKGGK